MARKKPARPTKKAARKAKKKPAPKAAARKAVKKTAKKTAKKAARKPGRKVTKRAAKPVKKAAKKVVKKTPKVAATKKPNLDRPRKTVADIHGIPSSLGMASLASAAHSGGEELRDTLKKNNSASPRLTGGDVVDEIGRALGVEYADDEELQGGAEIAECETHRWELDPSSKDDFEDEE